MGAKGVQVQVQGQVQVFFVQGRYRDSEQIHQIVNRHKSQAHISAKYLGIKYQVSSIKYQVSKYQSLVYHKCIHLHIRSIDRWSSEGGAGTTEDTRQGTNDLVAWR